MQRIDYDGHQHTVYHSGRRHPEATVEQWRTLLHAHSSRPPGRRWLDVGSGTGRFSVLLAESFDCTVIGVEPSAAMRAQARVHSGHLRVEYRAGSAESIAEPDGSFDAAMMSMVFHHLCDPAAGAGEIRRVLAPGARLFVRNATCDQHLESTFYQLFEAARAIDLARLPALAEVRACFTRAGFVERHHELVSQVTDSSLVAFAARMRTRPFSTFELMTEAEIDAGFARLEVAIGRDGSQTAHERVDLLVFEAT